MFQPVLPFGRLAEAKDLIYGAQIILAGSFN
jgi:hypothetical protein